MSFHAAPPAIAKHLSADTQELPERCPVCMSKGNPAVPSVSKYYSCRKYGAGFTINLRKHHTVIGELYQEKLKALELGLETRMTSKVGLLSGGQRQALTLLMASLEKPKLLLLDEHTAALDPKTAKKVLDLTEEIVNKDRLTTLMITHNMKDAIRLGNRLIMMHEGRIIYDVSGEEKKGLKVSDLLAKFEEASGGEFSNDRMMLS